MSERVLLEITAVVVLGIGSQWLAWWIRVPSILLLLTIGFLAGPVTGLLDPNQLLGDMLLPSVSLAVALILYEGGLSLRFRELRGGGIVMWRLVTMGAAVTWALSAVAAIYMLGFSPSIAVLMGAILVVTGPTVIVPLLREIRPAGRIGAILKWEGIVIDPIGAMLAVLVFEVIALGSMEEALPHVVRMLIETMLVGTGLGVATGFLLAILLRLYWIPDFLQNAVSLMMVIGVYTLSQHLRDESGLFAATVMGITLANQRVADVQHIVIFKENLRVLLISSLFILLAARLRLEQLASVGPAIIAFLIFLIAVVRPLSVLISTVGSKLPRREVMFLSVMAPRGIVAAAVASVFALRLQEQGVEGSQLLVPATFMVIGGTVLFCAIVAPWSAVRLGLAERNPQGLLIIGANTVARTLAKAITDQGFRVLLVDSNRENIIAARSQGIESLEGNILSETIHDEMDLAGIGRMIAMTPNAWVNMAAATRFAETFGRGAVYQVAPEQEAKSEQSEHKRHGRLLAGKKLNFREFSNRLNRGATVKATRLTEEFTLDDYRKEHGENTLLLMIITESKRLNVLANDQKAEPKAGQMVISLVDKSANGTRTPAA